MRSAIQVEQADGAAWLVVMRGEHDQSTADELQDALEEIGRHRTDIVLDLSQATFVDSAIVHAILDRARRPGESVAVVSPSGSAPRRVFDLLGLDGVLGVYESREEAVRGFTR